ncbi:MAG: hypothetical protein KC466_17360, partial [Myxococcales bacterium]|nr:hypothetical protein [Myxococcales bacterium]
MLEVTSRHLVGAVGIAGILAVTMGADCIPDDYVASWPQDTVEPGPYDESPAPGPLAVKAATHDAWHPMWHQPYYGGRASVFFTDATHTTVQSYGGWGDSTFFSGIYLGSQAMRYHVTGDAAAKDNAIHIVEALSGHLHVTGYPGYIARYRAPQSSIIYEGDGWCDTQERCFRVTSGPYAGDFWWGSTSRDQYIGWMFGMTMAYDLIDDEPTRDIIRADMAEVVLELIANNWTIIAQDGNPTGTAPAVLPPTQLSFAVQAYHVTGNPTILTALKGLLLNGNRLYYELAAPFNLFNRYDQYYGNNLAHLYNFQLLRLGKKYFSEDDYDFLQNYFDTAVHTFTRLSHNAWFNSVYMSQGPWTPLPANDPYLDQYVEDLTDFPTAPNSRVFVPARDPGTYTVDPVSQQLVDFGEANPWLADLFNVTFEIQSLEGFPVQQQCWDHFLWERNPFRTVACSQDEPRDVAPGADYLI